MLSKYAGVKIIKLFLDNPYSEIYLREVANKLKISSSTAKNLLDWFVEKELLKKHSKGNLILFSANMDDVLFKHMKIADSIYNIQQSGLIKYLVKESNPSSIVLYGSAARGEDDRTSDLDLLIISRHKKKPSLERFERKLNRKVIMVVYTFQEWQRKAKKDKPFYERILLDGIALHGELPVVL